MERRFLTKARLWPLLLLLAGLSGQKVLADGISFDPPEGNALTPFTITVDGFIGTNGPAAVDIGGSGISGFCNSTRPCSFAANMGYFSGKHWVTAGATVNGQYVTVSNYFVVREANAFINRACGTNGTKLTVTGYDFGRNQIVYVDNTQIQADTNGSFAVSVTINTGASGPYQIVAQDGFHFVTNTFTIGSSSVCEEDIGYSTGAGDGVTVTRPGSPRQPLRPGDPIHVGDKISTGAGGKYNVTFSDGTKLTLGPNSQVAIDNYFFTPGNGASDQFLASFLQGVFSYTSGLIDKHDDNATINTAYGSLGIRGTQFISRRDPCSATQEVYLIHGQLAIQPTYASVTNVVDAPATIFYDATNVWTSGLTQEAYDALASELNQTNPVTFGAWLAQYFGCTNENPVAVANADPDGDGQDNYAEFLARTDPTTNASVFKLISGEREGDGVRIAWQTHGGVTNLVQAASSLTGGYSDIGPLIVIPGDADVTTNYLDSGVITNAPSRFYRIRLAP